MGGLTKLILFEGMVRMNRKITLIIGWLVLIGPRLVCANDFPTNAVVLSFSDGRIFSSITQSNNSVIVGIPLTQAVFMLSINGKDMGIAGPLKTFSLKSGDSIDLAQKHGTNYHGAITTIHAEAEITPDEAKLKVTKRFDATDLGRDVKVDCFVFREKRK